MSDMGSGEKLPQMRSVNVELVRTSQASTSDQALWSAIRATTDAISWDRYEAILDRALVSGRQADEKADEVKKVVEAFTAGDSFVRNNPFPRTDTYTLLKVATEAFLETFCGVSLGDLTSPARQLEDAQRGVDPSMLNALWDAYRGQNVSTGKDDPDELQRVIPYLDIIRRKLKDQPIVSENAARLAYGIVSKKLQNPPMIELIWSYWMEEGGLVQTMNAILYRFQNRRSGRGRDPLAHMELDPLRSLNNVLWGFVQDEQHRLSVARRAYEYDHHYGFSIQGPAVPRLRTADSRPKLIEALNHMLARCAVFYEQDDDTTRIADGFPVLNALKEVHLLLTQGGHNQYGDLPWMARQEMMMMQWVLARPEVREFLNGRPMVAYAEPWMDRVDTMKTLQCWTDTSVTHFRDLAVFGERILLSARFGAWSKVTIPQQAANWARYFRAEIQGYIHAYRAVTGVDVSATNDPQQRQLAAEQPSALLADRERRAARR